MPFLGHKRKKNAKKSNLLSSRTLLIEGLLTLKNYRKAGAIMGFVPSDNWRGKREKIRSMVESWYTHPCLSVPAGMDPGGNFWPPGSFRWKFWPPGSFRWNFLKKMPSRCLFLATGMSRWKILEKYAILVYFFGDRDVPVRNFVKKSIPVILFVPSQWYVAVNW